jgi:hypothetical protein
MKTNYCLITLVVFAGLLLTSCGSQARIGALQTESQSVELGDAKSVRVEIVMGAGNLDVTSGADKLMQANFTYNVAKLKPEVRYTAGTLIVQQPKVSGLPVLQGITDYRNEWDLRLSDGVPMDLRVDLGAGASNLKLAGLSLTGLNVSLGAGEYMIDLSGDWPHDLDVSIDGGAADLTVRLPKDVGVRVEVDRGPAVIDASGLTQDGDVYTNVAYGVSNVTLHINMTAGIGRINLEVDDQ